MADLLADVIETDHWGLKEGNRFRPLLRTSGAPVEAVLTRTGFHTRLQIDDAEPRGVRHRVGTADGVELVEQRSDVEFGGMNRNSEPSRDRLVRCPFGHQQQARRVRAASGRYRSGRRRFARHVTPALPSPPPRAPPAEGRRRRRAARRAGPRAPDRRPRWRSQRPVRLPRSRFRPFPDRQLDPQRFAGAPDREVDDGADAFGTERAHQRPHARRSAGRSSRRSHRPGAHRPPPRGRTCRHSSPSLRRHRRA